MNHDDEYDGDGDGDGDDDGDDDCDGRGCNCADTHPCTFVELV